MFPRLRATTVAKVVLAALAFGPLTGSAALADDPIYAQVDGLDVSHADIETVLLVRPIPGLAEAAARKVVGEQLVDERLMGAYLKKYKVVVPDQVIDRQLRGIARGFLTGDSSLDQQLKSIGSSRGRLRKLLVVPMAWRIHMLRTVTPESMQKYFESHRAQFDGTQLRVSQILLKSKGQAATKQLEELKQKIESGTISFADAARESSESPSGKNGGDLGFFGYRGQMPVSFTSQVFELNVGEISGVFASSYGTHLCLVTERVPGELSLEDVREQILSALSRELWNATVKRLRSEATIEYAESPKS